MNFASIYKETVQLTALTPEDRIDLLSSLLELMSDDEIKRAVQVTEPDYLHALDDLLQDHLKREW